MTKSMFLTSDIGVCSIFTVGQHVNSKEVLKVFIICNNVNGEGQTIEIVAPNFESLKNS